MSKIVYEKYDGSEVTDDMLAEASKLFNENYGIWGKDAAKTGAFAKPKSRVRLNKDRLRTQCLPDGAAFSYVKVSVEGRLVGNAFACRWVYRGQTVCWVTQLVVHRDFRERGIAATLLNHIRKQDDGIYGIMSSHPAACLAAAKAFGHGLHAAPLDFIRQHAGAVLEASPVGYIKKAKLRGSLFDAEETNGAVSSVYTQFFVDHTEPLEALAWVREGMEWPLGDLLGGHEFLFLLKVRRRGRFRSRSAPGSDPVS
ncbi:hypothetical protein BCR34DRAFT_622053 [Clohesyomyces aquaticus]|uniref:N-acetyltransferase domain-containing protein n=1 Tax=Clohesyomyces aquaticus TaxID=1231657 RepID=A0A1Y2A3J7_9PLEO|nr:hypothetical protein BCR34DRAFT_622053 [Clohesyomyces aquaticus]